MYKYLPVVIAILLTSTCSFAQNAKAYIDAQAYLNNEYTPIDDIIIKKEKVRGPFNDYQYHLSAHDYDVNENIAWRYWAIEVDNKLYLSCKNVFNPKKGHKAKHRMKDRFKLGTYVLAQYRSNKYLHFRAGRTNVFGVPRSPVVTDAGVAAAALSYASTPREDIFPIYNYLYDFRTHKVLYFNRGVMMNYLDEASPKDEQQFIKHVNQLIKIEDEMDGVR